MLKSIGYRLFALVYYLCRILPVKTKRVLCIMTHDDGEGSNVSLAVKALGEQGTGYTFAYITKKETLEVKGISSIKGLLSFFFTKPYQLSRAQIILMDNVFLPFAYLKRRKGVKVIQLWHGTGTIKKFGQHVNTGHLKNLEYRANINITHLIVNSEETKRLYAQTFGIEEDRVYPIGLPKTDELIRRLREAEKLGINRDREAVYRRYSIPDHARLVLYAPTFRDQELDGTTTLKQLSELRKGLPKNYYLGLKLHPFIAEACSGVRLPQGVCQMSYDTDTNALLMASDILITDYSSIIFEYCLIGRPMVFYAYDLKEYSDQGRGFYYEYESYVPGPVVATAEEAAAIISEHRFDLDTITRFKDRNYLYLDGKATERLLQLIME